MAKKSPNLVNQPLPQRHLLGMIAVIAYLGYLTNVHRVMLGPLVHLVLPQVFIIALSWYIATNMAQRAWSRIGIALLCSCMIATIGVSPQIIRWQAHPPTITERIIEKQTKFAPSDISTRYGITEAKRLFLVGQSEVEARQQQQTMSFSPFSSRLIIENNPDCQCSRMSLAPITFGPIYHHYQAGPDVTSSKKGDVAVLPFPHVQAQFTTHHYLPTQTISIAVFNGVNRTAQLTMHVPTDVCALTVSTTIEPTALADTNSITLKPFSHLVSKTCYFFSDTAWTHLFQQIWHRTNWANARKPETIVDSFLLEAIDSQSTPSN